MCRSAWASVQPDQYLRSLPPRWYNLSSFYIRNFEISLLGGFVSYLAMIPARGLIFHKQMCVKHDCSTYFVLYRTYD